MTPGFIARDIVHAYACLGELHGKHRGLQTTILATAARGELAQRLIARDDLVAMDTLVRRWDLPAIAAAEEKHLDEESRRRLDAYLAGVRKGLGRWFLPPPDRVSVLSGLMLSSYLGLAQGQERMELALMQAVSEGADLALLEQMFAPHLHGWQPQRMRSVQLPKLFRVAGGSNAWAVSGKRTASGFPLLAGDPHLQIDQWPALFFEIAARVGDDYWLGATIPGLPGMALGRNKHVAWTGTFSVADNVDFTFDDGLEHLTTREVQLKRRFKAPLTLRFVETNRGVLEGGLACEWYSRQKPARSLAAYLRLPEVRSAEECEKCLEHANTLSLHFVIADRAGDVRYKQVGSIASGRDASLYPGTTRGPLLDGRDLPREQADVICSANEERPSPQVLTTLAQPNYRLNRIRSVLEASHAHTVESFQRLQLDVYSPQAELFSRRWDLPMWDFCYTENSLDAAAFDATYRAAVKRLPLGGEWFHRMIDETELSVWWCRAIDRALLTMPPAERQPPGKPRQVSFKHMLTGLGPGPFPHPGSIATVRQGNVVAGQVIGPAYRFITDLGTDEAWSTLPGGIDGSPWSDTYACYLSEWREGRYHRLFPPTGD